jgi:hypothetical protein
LKIPANFSRYFISDISPYFFDLASNPQYAQKLVEYNFIRAQTVSKALESLDDESIFDNQKLEYLFLIGFEFAGNVLNKYWFLSEKYANKVKNLINDKFKGNYMIGMQLRFEFLNKDDVNSFLSCARMIERENEKIIGNRTVKWFVSTDNAVFAEEIKANYTDKIVQAVGKIGHVVLNSDAYERSLLDIELLSQCDEVILTGGSTFGFMSSLKKQKRPYFVEGKNLIDECKIFKFFAPSRTPRGHAVF